MLKQIFALVAGVCLATACTAQKADAAVEWKAGTHYKLVEPAQAFEQSTDKVEVVEVFSYACPHCAHFQPAAAKLKASLPDGAEFRYVPAIFSARWAPYARAYFTARDMGVLDKSHQALFDALHRDRKPLYDLKALAGFYSQFGVDPEEFLSTAQSFLVQNQMKRANDWVMGIGVRATPTIVVNGKYMATAESAGGVEQLLKLVDWLVAKELAARDAS